MATIQGMRRVDNQKIIFEMSLSHAEALNLQGHTDDIYLLCDSVETVPSRISLRGKNEATKYFLIPKTLRKDIQFHY